MLELFANECAALAHAMTAPSFTGNMVSASSVIPDADPDLPPNVNDPLRTVFSYGQGVVVTLGVIGILFSAGKMAVGKFGRSDLAADGVGSIVWVVFGISLMLVAIPLVRQFA